MCKRNVCNLKTKWLGFKVSRRSLFSNGWPFSRYYHAGFTAMFTALGKRRVYAFRVGNVIVDRFRANASGFAPDWRQFIYLALILTTLGAKKLEISKAKSRLVRFLSGA